MRGMIDGRRRFDGNCGWFFCRHDSVVEVEKGTRVGGDRPESLTTLDNLEAHHRVQDDDDGNGRPRGISGEGARSEECVPYGDIINQDPEQDPLGGDGTPDLRL